MSRKTLTPFQCEIASAALISRIRHSFCVHGLRIMIKMCNFKKSPALLKEETIVKIIIKGRHLTSYNAVNATLAL